MLKNSVLVLSLILSISSTAHAANGKIVGTLKSYSYHDNEPSRPNSEIKVFVPPSGTHWKLEWSNAYASGRNNEKFTSYEVRFIPSKDRVERIELETKASHNTDEYLVILVNWGPSTWIEATLEFSLMPADPSPTDGIPLEARDYLTTIYSLYGEHESKLRREFENTTNNLIQISEQDSDSEQFKCRAEKEVGTILGRYTSTVFRVVNALNQLESEVPNIHLLREDIETFLAMVRRSEKEFLKLLWEFADLLRLNKNKIDCVNVVISGLKIPDYKSPDCKSKEELDSFKDFIAKCYRESLNREPDASGLSCWSTVCREQGLRAAQLGIDASDEAFIHKCYRKHLNRWTDPGGMAFWMGELKKTNRDQVNANIAWSEEAFIHTCYKTHLGRWADPGGMAFWQSELKKTSRDQVSANTACSQEAQNRRNGR